MNIAWFSSIPGALIGGSVVYHVGRVQWSDRRREAATQREQEEARARREAWRSEYEGVRGLLIAAADLAYQVDTRGPLTRRDFEDLHAAKVHTDLEQASRRVPDELQDPITAVAKRAAELLPHAVASDTETLDVYEGVRLGEAAKVPSERTIRSEHVRSVAQDRAAADLAEAVSAARAALTKAWGG